MSVKGGLDKMCGEAGLLLEVVLHWTDDKNDAQYPIVRDAYSRSATPALHTPPPLVLLAPQAPRLKCVCGLVGVRARL